MSGLDQALQVFAPISLDELTDQAALMTRVDRKYVLSSADAQMLAATMPATTRVLEIGGRRRFGYQSLYFDTARLEAYRRTAQRRRRRFKVRTRSYDTGADFLEVKTRQLAATVKERIPYHAPGLALDAAGHAYAHQRLAAAGIDLQTELLATLWTSYRRSTLLLPSESARVTLDTDLRWTAPVVAATLALQDLTIVETKSGSQASSADRLLWSLGYRPVSISKYGTGLAALYPELPRNRWHRLLGSIRPHLHEALPAH